MSQTASRHMMRIALVGAAFAVLGTHVWPAQAKPQRTTSPSPAHIETARDADTFDMDKALVTACKAQGRALVDCICLTHILKYESSLDVYRASVSLYPGIEWPNTIKARNESWRILPRHLITAQKRLDEMNHATDLAVRCETAKAYYKRRR